MQQFMITCTGCICTNKLNWPYTAIIVFGFLCYMPSHDCFLYQLSELYVPLVSCQEIHNNYIRPHWSCVEVCCYINTICSCLLHSSHLVLVLYIPEGVHHDSQCIPYAVLELVVNRPKKKNSLIANHIHVAGNK